MIQVIPSSERFSFENAWLHARWHFSFGHYIDEKNMGFGPLRVFNDDVVQARNGFPMHRHDEMEIVTYIIEGELTHEDSTGGKGVIKAGEVQRMTAGRGIRHSEINRSDKPVHLLQIWFEPGVARLDPGYEQTALQLTPGVLVPVVSGQASVAGAALSMKVDATMYVGKLTAGQHVEHAVAAGRRAYVFVIEGAVDVNGTKLAAGDQARLTDETRVGLDVKADAHVMVIDLP